MPPKRHAPQDPMDVLAARIDKLERLYQQLYNVKTPTIPIYDYNNLPAEAIEGQLAIILNAPTLP